jgi:hypothetical protein
MPQPAPYACQQHIRKLAPADAAAGLADVGAAGASTTTAAPPTVALIRALPKVLTDAARVGVTGALRLLGAWSRDSDLVDLVDDLVDTLNFGAASTATKNRSALRRLGEFVRAAPAALATAVAQHDAIDITLSSYVAARLRVHKRTLPPPEWRPPHEVPEPPSVKGEVSAIVGLCRLAALLPPDPRGTLPLTRRVMRKCGCFSKHAASPRAYTFAWELQTAWRAGHVPRNNPQAVAAFNWFMCALQFVLRPRYVRAAQYVNILPDAASAQAWRLDWVHGDKTRQPELTEEAAVALAAKAAGAGSGRGGASSSRSRTAPRHVAEIMDNLPARHPRVTCSAGTLFDETLRQWREFRGADPGPLFCRTEVARQTAKVPPGARLLSWHAPDGTRVPTYVWHASPISDRILKRWLVAILAPIVGADRARARVLSGLRGGSAMELEALGAPLSVRATLGWWVARLLHAEGALITYTGCSMEAMAQWTSRLGERRIRVLAPGVYRHVPEPTYARSVRARTQARNAAEARRAAVPAAPAPASAPVTGGDHPAVSGGGPSATPDGRTDAAR